MGTHTPNFLLYADKRTEHRRFAEKGPSKTLFKVMFSQLQAVANFTTTVLNMPYQSNWAVLLLFHKGMDL